MNQENEEFIKYLKDLYGKVFENQWPAWLGGFLLGLTNVFLFAYAQPWGVAAGIRNWADWFFELIGLYKISPPLPLLHSTSILNLGLLFGAFTAALLAKEFNVRIAPGRQLIKGFIGGCLMGTGAALSMGCNIGGFFSAVSALSLGGLAMMLGLIIGSYLGLRYLIWEMEKGFPLNSPVSGRIEGRKNFIRFQPHLGGLAILIVLGAVIAYNHTGHAKAGGLFLFGILLGVIIQRTRLCFVSAFRDPFMTGGTEQTKGVILAMAISVIGFSILKGTDLRATMYDVHAGAYTIKNEWVFPTFWWASLVGGTIFGVGMVIAGGCASGSLWRAGEGHVQLWMALLGFAIFNSGIRYLWVTGERITAGFLGKAIYIPEVVGGMPLALLLILGILLIWYFIVSWNEITGKFSLM